MADFNNSINMTLPIPTVSVAPGPLWATLLDSCLTIIDGHSHVAGSGVPITPSALNINSDLTMGSNNLTDARTIRFTSQVAALATATDLGCLYEVADDLYYNDGSGNQIRLTQSGSIVGTAGSITGLPSGTASASYVSISSKFAWQSATNTAADMDMGAAIMRNISPNSTYALTLQPPASLGSNYSITLPSLPASTRIVSLNASGALATGVASTVVTSDITDQNITQGKLALRTTGTTAPVGGVAASGFTSNSTSSTSFGLVTSCILSTAGRPVMVMLGADPSGGLISTGFGGGIILVAIYRDATRICAHQVTSSSSEITVPASISVIDYPAAGTYTYSLQIRSGTGGDFVGVSNINIVAYEL